MSDKGNTETAAALLDFVKSTAREVAEKVVAESAEPRKSAYVANSRIEEIRSVAHEAFDLSKLQQLCVELNHAWQADSHFSVIFVLRAIIDHVPPVFGKDKFNEVSNNYPCGPSVKKSLKRLNESSRDIANNHIHYPCGSGSTIPNEVQVNFSQELDVLLSEVLKILGK